MIASALLNFSASQQFPCEAISFLSRGNTLLRVTSAEITLVTSRNTSSEMNPHGRGPTGRLSLVDVGASEAESTVERTLARKEQ